MPYRSCSSWIPSITSEPGSSGRENTLRLCRESEVSSNTAKSVNDPPISTPTRYVMILGSISWLLTITVIAIEALQQVIAIAHRIVAWRVAGTMAIVQTRHGAIQIHVEEIRTGIPVGP